MLSGRTAELDVLLKLKDELSAGLKKAEGSLSHFDSRVSLTQQGLTKIGAGLKVGVANVVKLSAVAGAAAVTGLAAALRSGVEEFNQEQTAAAQTAAVLKSTGGVAHVTAQQITELARALQNKDAIDADQIRSAENLLLTFTNIRNEVGAGNDIFNQATQATLDLSTAIGQDLKSSSIQLGKALNDPVRGLTALRRVGVSFTADQEKQIKALVKNNDLLGAQKIILAELNKEFGGSAAAKAGTFAGQQERLALALKDLKVALAGAAIPGLTAFSKGLADLLTSPDLLRGAANLGKSIGDLFSAANLKNAVQFARDVLPGIADGLKLAGTAAKTIFDLWSKLPKELQGIAVAALIGNKLTGGLVASGIGDILKGGLKGLGATLFSRGGSPATPLFVQQVGGVPGTGGPGGGVAPIIPLALITAAAVGVAKQVADANDFRNQRTTIRRSTPTLTNAEALALQIEARGGMSTLDRRSAEGAITAFRNEATSYADALASAHRKLNQDLADTGSALKATAKALRGDATSTGRRNQNAADMKAAVREGNRDLTTRRDTDKLGLNIALGLRELRSGVQQVERTAAAQITNAIFDVVRAVQGIKFPAYLGTAAQQGRGTGAGGRTAVSPAAAAAGAAVGIEKNRGRNLNVHIKSSVTTRSVDSAGATQSRYGPTPTRAGAAVVLVS